MNPTRIEIVIDDLILTGFPRADRHRIAEAIQARLTEQFTAAPSAALKSADHIDAGEFHVGPAAKPAAIGAQAARTIHRSVTR